MRLLVIPDLHHHTAHAEHWLSTQRYDRALFLGDYFDDFGDGVTDARRTALWLRTRMETTGDLFLLGNHDIAYLLAADPQFFCPGFTAAKSAAINKVLTDAHWSRLQLIHEEQGWLFSHAGFHPTSLAGLPMSALAERCQEAMRQARHGVFHPLFGAGGDRGGPQRVGGPLWLDWQTLAPIAGINQIVGHTPGRSVREKITAKSANYCLDVANGSAAAIVEDGRVEVLEMLRASLAG